MSNGNFYIEVVTTIDKFISLKSEWTFLLNRQKTNTPFQSWEWNYGFIASNENTIKPNVLVLRNLNDDIVGIAPFQLRKIIKPGLRFLEFIGGEKSDYQDFIFLEECKTIFYDKVFEWIENSRNWLILNLTCLRYETAEILSSKSGIELIQHEVCPLAVLPNSIEEFEDNISKILKSSIKRKLKQLQKNNRINFKIASTSDEFESYFNILVHLHQKRQNEKGELGKFVDKSFVRSFKEIGYNLFKANILRLGVIFIDDAPAAANFNLRLHQKEYTYMGGINSEFNEFRPGNILDYLMVTSGIPEGVQSYDFLQGNEKYKADWTNSQNKLYRLSSAKYVFVFYLWNKYLDVKKNIYGSDFIRYVYNTAVKVYKNKHTKTNKSKAVS